MQHNKSSTPHPQAGASVAPTPRAPRRVQAVIAIERRAGWRAQPASIDIRGWSSGRSGSRPSASEHPSV